MRHIAILVVALFAAVTAGHAQGSYERILYEVEKNSTTLQALKQQSEAQKLESRTGIYLSNPEVEMKHVWVGGGTTELSVKQAFDFPTAYSYKSGVANARGKLADLEYEVARKELLYDVAAVCINLTYQNIQKTELEKRLTHAEAIATATQLQFERGETDILERNKAQLSLLSAKKALEANEVERAALLSELARLNGGISLAYEETVYPAYAIPPDFEQWYRQVHNINPAIQYAAYNVELSKKQEKLNRAVSYPKLWAGYSSEWSAGAAVHGVSVGISIPLWENKNTVKSVKLQTKALESVEADKQQQFYNQLKMQHTKAVNLGALVKDYREMLNTVNSSDLLKKALDNGQLSLLAYFIELGMYYDAVDSLLEAERSYQYAVWELHQWEF